jgi:F-type H+-transporting ATPase subunit epsilon
MTTTNIMNVDLVDSESRIYAGEAEYLVISAFDGEIGIYPHHIPLISKLRPGLLRIKVPGDEEQKIFAISGGFLEVCDNSVIMMIDRLERTDELDEQRLIEQKNLALERVKHTGSSSTSDVAKAMASLEIAIAQLKALEYIRKFRRKGH